MKIKLMVNVDGANRTYLFFNSECFYGKDPFMTESIARFDIDISRLEEALKLEKGALDHLKRENYVEEKRNEF